MHIGRQEDAHEFLRLLIEAMQKTCVNGFDKWVDLVMKMRSTIVDRGKRWVFIGGQVGGVVCAPRPSPLDPSSNLTRATSCIGFWVPSWVKFHGSTYCRILPVRSPLPAYCFISVWRNGFFPRLPPPEGVWILPGGTMWIGFSVPAWMRGFPPLEFRPVCCTFERARAQGIFSLVKATLWGKCKFLLEHFKSTWGLSQSSAPAQAPRADIHAIRAAPKCRLLCKLRTQRAEPKPELEAKPSFEKGPKAMTRGHGTVLCLGVFLPHVKLSICFCVLFTILLLVV